MCIYNYLFNSFVLLLSCKLLLLSTIRILVNIYIYALYYLHIFLSFVLLEYFKFLAMLKILIFDVYIYSLLKTFCLQKVIPNAIEPKPQSHHIPTVSLLVILWTQKKIPCIFTQLDS